MTYAERDGRDADSAQAAPRDSALDRIKRWDALLKGARLDSESLRDAERLAIKCRADPVRVVRELALQLDKVLGDMAWSLEYSAEAHTMRSGFDDEYTSYVSALNDLDAKLAARVGKPQ